MQLISPFKTRRPVLIGFDLKKDPITILAAYNDAAGLHGTSILILLYRINDELNANFNPGAFYHYPTYDPATGACKSYLVSKRQQQVLVSNNTFSFEEGEPISMEISQKYTEEQTDDLARKSGFKPIHHFYDSKKWFVDAVWKCV